MKVSLKCAHSPPTVMPANRIRLTPCTSRDSNSEWSVFS